MEYSYTLTWDVLRAGQPASTWVGAALWGVALIFFIAGMVVARRLRIRSGRERKGLKRTVSIISLTIVVGTVVGGVVWEKVVDPRRGQQAEFLQRELGITVRDPGSLPGFRARELTVDIVAPTEIRGCELWTRFEQKGGAISDDRGSSGERTSRMLVNLSCPQPIPTSVAQRNLD